MGGGGGGAEVVWRTVCDRVCPVWQTGSLADCGSVHSDSIVYKALESQPTEAQAPTAYRHLLSSRRCNALVVCVPWLSALVLTRTGASVESVDVASACLFLLRRACWAAEDVGPLLPAVPAIVHAMRTHVADPMVAEHGTVCLRNLVQGAVDKVGVIVGCADSARHCRVTAESLQSHCRVGADSRGVTAVTLACRQ